MAGYAALTVYMAWANYSEGVLREALLERGKTAQAKVYELRRTSGGRGGGSRLYIRYSYVDAYGEASKHETTPPDSLPSPKVGDTFEVTYVPETPEQHWHGRVDPEQHRRAQRENLELSLAMFAALLLMGLICWFMPRAGAWMWAPAIVVMVKGGGTWVGLLMLTLLLGMSLRDWWQARSLTQPRT
jgi:hypothetical protein